MDGVIATGLEVEGPLWDKVSFRWWISFLTEEQGDYWGCDFTTPKVLACSLWDAGPPSSPGPSHLPHAPPTPPLGTPEGPHSTMLTGRCPPHSLEDPALLQAVLATIPHSCIVHSLNGPVNGLKDILLKALDERKG